MTEYPDHHIVEWCVKTTCDTVELTSSSFAIEDGHDFVLIRDDVANISWKYTGEQNITLDVNSDFTVLFTSDSSENDDGFAFNYSCKELQTEGCLADDGRYNNFWMVKTNCSFGVDVTFNSTDDFPEFGKLPYLKYILN